MKQTSSESNRFNMQTCFDQSSQQRQQNRPVFQLYQEQNITPTRLSRQDQMKYFQDQLYLQNQTKNLSKPIQNVFLIELTISGQLYSQQIQREILELYELSYPFDWITDKISQKYDQSMSVSVIEYLLNKYKIQPRAYKNSQQEINVHLVFSEGYKQFGNLSKSQHNQKLAKIE
ncbi:Hypothetical_protein [Hexamita inflata]|uniref:Hypothetical_protein n=1 Tax=Hexamita inflata TaxID=28002 RepID=A0AA86N8C5_9EUKA|nr:Hypothetical protein HINF_LOCUS2241 [Hexamita inflata]